MRKILCFIIPVILISCSKPEENMLKGTWAIDLIEINGEDIMYNYYSNLISFKKNNDVTFPHNRQHDFDNTGKWFMSKEKDTSFLTIETDGNEIAGRYRITFEKDYEQKLLKMQLSSSNMKIICSKVLYNFDRK